MWCCCGCRPQPGLLPPESYQSQEPHGTECPCSRQMLQFEQKDLNRPLSAYVFLVMTSLWQAGWGWGVGDLRAVNERITILCYTNLCRRSCNGSDCQPSLQAACCLTQRLQAIVHEHHKPHWLRAVHVSGGDWAPQWHCGEHRRSTAKAPQAQQLCQLLYHSRESEACNKFRHGRPWQVLLIHKRLLDDTPWWGDGHVFEDLWVLQREQNHLLQLLNHGCMATHSCPALRNHIVVDLSGLWDLT